MITQLFRRARNSKRDASNKKKKAPPEQLTNSAHTETTQKGKRRGETTKSSATLWRRQPLPELAPVRPSADELAGHAHHFQCGQCESCRVRFFISRPSVRPSARGKQSGFYGQRHQRWFAANVERIDNKRRSETRDANSNCAKLATRALKALSRGAEFYLPGKGVRRLD